MTLCRSAAPFAVAMLGGAASASVRSISSVPRPETRDDRHALIVDGAPFLILGAQVDDSSNYPPRCRGWPMIERIHANTVAVPVAWQQVEPVEGRFDCSFVQPLLDQARGHDKRLVLLWSGTWKNTVPGDMHDWFKLDDARFPRMKDAAGQDHYVHTALAEATLDADRRAFVALIGYLEAHDPQNTVILVQVENEVGSYRLPRDHSPAADRLFAQGVPAELARKLGRRPGSWAEMFGAQADRAFTAWHTARFVGAVAAAGKAVKPIPRYVNAALAGPSNVPDPTGVASGGPQQDKLGVRKAGAPAIDRAGSDIDDRASGDVVQTLDRYDRPDNALTMAGIGNARIRPLCLRSRGAGRHRLHAVRHRRHRVSERPAGRPDAGRRGAGRRGAASCRLRRHDARLGQDRVRASDAGAFKPDDGTGRSTMMGDWTIGASRGAWQFGQPDWTWPKADPAPWAKEPVGGVAVAQLSTNEFLVTGDHVRISFGTPPGGPAHGMVVRVDQGHFDRDRWVMDRIRNGDQTEHGMNLIDRPTVLKVTMGAYR